MSYIRTINTPSIIGKEGITGINYTSEDEVTLLRESDPCLYIHIAPFDESERRIFVNQQRTVESLGQLAHYLDLRAPFYKPEYVVGLTHLAVGRIAAKWFHFDLTATLPIESYPEDVLEIIQKDYHGTPCMVTMPVERLFEKYKSGEAPQAIRESIQLSNAVEAATIRMMRFATFAAAISPITLQSNHPLRHNANPSTLDVNNDIRLAQSTHANYNNELY